MMESSKKRSIKASCILSLCWTSSAFQTLPISTVSIRLKAQFEPNGISDFIPTTHDAQSEIVSLLSTALAPAVEPAHGHSNPLFGPPDPYIAAGKSIAPSAKALTNLGVTHANNANEMFPDSSDAFKESMATAASKGWKLMNGADIHLSGVNHLPGFFDTKGIFGSKMVPFESPESFAAEVKWAAGYFDVMDKLPFVAFWYALIEFFILRPGVDLYKEEVEDDPEGVIADTISIGIIRLIAFGLISFSTVVFFG